MKKGFTLIELLVVIAIIAILAAILFPVFAQAKLAAKKTQALSNTKQLGTAIQIYLNDVDDMYPHGFGATVWTGTDLWCQEIQPYVKNVDVFGSPGDNQASRPNPAQTWEGVGISFAANSYYGDWCCAPDWNTGYVLRGPMGVENSNYPWLNTGHNNGSAMTQPAGTILLAEKHGDDVFSQGAADPFNESGNWSNFAANGIIAGWHVDGASGWGPLKEPCGANCDGTTSPRPNLATTPFGKGPNGAVSAKFMKNACFVYLDSHAAAKQPPTTNPDPVNHPDLNQWDGMR